MENKQIFSNITSCPFIVNRPFRLIFIILSISMQKFVILSLFLILAASHSHSCVHDEFIKDLPKHFLNDLTDHRLLAPAENGRIRIFVDYTQVTIGSKTEINTIKRATNITSSYFYNILNVTRLPKLYYPPDAPLQCNTLKVPEEYVTQGAIGDLGVVCGNENNPDAVYIAKSAPCALLESNKRTIWGMMSWNNAFLAFDQEGFQQVLYVGIHEMTHILGFTAMMYELYPNGNPLTTDEIGNFYLNSPRIQEEINNHFGCNSSVGLPLEDQDGTLIASHWERKIVGNDYMIATNKKGAYLSRFTLALLESSGWYTYVNYDYAEKTTWGKGKGCAFLNIDNCASEEFCQDSSFSCDWDATGIGRCTEDAYTGACKTIRYYTNTVCIDENFELKNLNAKLNALERGGSNSKCFSSDFRQEGSVATKLNNRCYLSICSSSGKFIYILVGQYVLICRTPGTVITGPPGLSGTLTCPRDFSRYCENKVTCPFHCNKNGVCINGKCLCTGFTQLSPSCIDVSIFLAPIGSTGGLLNNNKEHETQLVFNDQGQLVTANTQSRSTIKSYSIDSKCIQGTALDPDFGDCIPCRQKFNCNDCNDNGCVSCDNGDAPINGRCSARRL